MGPVFTYAFYFLLCEGVAYLAAQWYLSGLFAVLFTLVDYLLITADPQYAEDIWLHRFPLALLGWLVGALFSELVMRAKPLLPRVHSWGRRRSPVHLEIELSVGAGGQQPPAQAKPLAQPEAASDGRWPVEGARRPTPFYPLGILVQICFYALTLGFISLNQNLTYALLTLSLHAVFLWVAYGASEFSARFRRKRHRQSYYAYWAILLVASDALLALSSAWTDRFAQNSLDYFWTVLGLGAASLFYVALVEWRMLSAEASSAVAEPESGEGAAGRARRGGGSTAYVQ